MTIRMPWFAGATTLTSWLIIHRWPDRRPQWQQDMTMAHERIHQKQMRRDGWFRFMWRYLTDSVWRATYEAEAYATNIRAYTTRYPTKPQSAFVEQYARILATSRTYTWLGKMPPVEQCRMLLYAYLKESA